MSAKAISEHSTFTGTNQGEDFGISFWRDDSGHIRELSCRNSFILFAFCLDAGYRLQNLPLSQRHFTVYSHF